MTTKYLKLGAGGTFTESGDAVEVVGGDGLVLLLDETEGREAEASFLAVTVFQHGGELIPRAPGTEFIIHWPPLYYLCICLFVDSRDKEIEKGGIGRQGRDGSIAPI